MVQLADNLQQRLRATTDKYPDVLTELQDASAQKLGFDYLDLEVTPASEKGKLPTVMVCATPLGAVVAGQAWEGNKRTYISPGKLFNRLWPDNPDKVRGVVEALRQAAVKDISTYRVQLISGPEIHTQYRAGRSCGGDLATSCMAVSAPEWLEIYTANPDIVQLVCVLNAQSQLCARALLWTDIEVLAPTTNKEVPAKVTLLDRQYASSHQALAWLRNWAHQHNYLLWVTKESFEFKAASGKIHALPRALVRLQTRPLGRWRYNKAPYLDTFRCLKKGESRLCNWQPDRNYRQFDKADGSFYDSDGDYVPWVPPGHVLTVSGAIILESQAFNENGLWYAQSELKCCTLCRRLTGRAVSRRFHNRCARTGAPAPVHIMCRDCAEKDEVVIGGVPYKPCGERCLNWVANGPKCFECLGTSYWCTTCEQVMGSPTVEWVDNVYQCKSCQSLNTDFCFTCAKRLLVKNLSTLNECTDCQLSRDNTKILWISN